MAKKETKLPSRQVTQGKALFQMFFSSKDTGQPKKHQILSDSVKSWDTGVQRQILPGPVGAPNASHLLSRCGRPVKVKMGRLA